MSLRNHRRRRGSVVVYGLLALAIGLPFLALAIDLGRIAVVRAELQNAADAAALAGASVLREGKDASEAAAETFGEYNSVNGGNAALTVDDDVEVGRWNKSSRTFQTLSNDVQVNANAVRVTCRVNSDRGNQLPLFFAPIFGRDFSELEATAVATVDNASQMSSRIVGKNLFYMSGSSHTDSFDSTDGPYDFVSAGQNGTVCTNDNINMSGYTEINGDAHPGVGKVVQGSGTVTGSEIPLNETLTLPAIQIRDADVNNNNGDIPNTDAGRSPLTAGMLRLYPSDSLALPGGIYYFTHLILSGGATLTVTDQTVIFVTGNVSMNGATIANTTEIPTNLQIYCAGTAVSCSGASEFHGVIYAPNARIVRTATAGYFGMAIGKEVIMSGTGGIHADDSLGVLYGLPSYPTLVE